MLLWRTRCLAQARTQAVGIGPDEQAKRLYLTFLPGDELFELLDTEGEGRNQGVSICVLRPCAGYDKLGRILSGLGILAVLRDSICGSNIYGAVEGEHLIDDLGCLLDQASHFIQL